MVDSVPLGVPINKLDTTQGQPNDASALLLFSIQIYCQLFGPVLASMHGTFGNVSAFWFSVIFGRPNATSILGVINTKKKKLRMSVVNYSYNQIYVHCRSSVPRYCFLTRYYMMCILQKFIQLL